VDALVLISTDFCPSCKRVERDLEQVARRFAPVDSVVIGKLDFSHNDVVDENVSNLIKGYPCILFFPAGGVPRSFLGCDSMHFAWTDRDRAGFEDRVANFLVLESKVLQTPPPQYNATFDDEMDMLDGTLGEL